jgi:hypothetical protein
LQQQNPLAKKPSPCSKREGREGGKHTPATVPFPGISEQSLSLLTSIFRGFIFNKIKIEKRNAKSL